MPVTSAVAHCLAPARCAGPCACTTPRAGMCQGQIPAPGRRTHEVLRCGSSCSVSRHTAVYTALERSRRRSVRAMRCSPSAVRGPVLALSDPPRIAVPSEPWFQSETLCMGFCSRFSAHPRPPVPSCTTRMKLNSPYCCFADPIFVILLCAQRVVRFLLQVRSQASLVWV
jgi:hypothetical protein